MAQVPDGVGRTALGMARVRAEESERPDRLFDDPYASVFLAAAPGALPEHASGAARRTVSSTPGLARLSASGRAAWARPRRLLTRHGWRVRPVDRDVVAEHYGRPGPRPARGGFLTADIAAA